MNKIPKSKTRPKWINENLPEELLGTDFFVFKVELKSKDPKTGKPVSISIDMLPDLDLDYDILEQQVECLPAQYAFWASVYSELRNNVAFLERAVKIRKGQVIEEVQRSAKAEGLKFTADQVKSVVEVDDTLNRVEGRLERAQMQTGKVFHMMEALKMKSELARSLAGFKRQEYSKNG